MFGPSVCHQEVKLYQRELVSSSDGFASSMLSTWPEVVCTAPCLLWVRRETEHVHFFNQYWC